MIREQWDGTEWQEYCCMLLRMKYGTEIQIIPDRDRGDGGLEAYHFNGTGYQCYAPEEAYDTDALTEAQKAKIRKDIRRLIDDPVGTSKLLGEVILIKWVLLTPDFDSRKLVEYARYKSIKTRAHPRPKWCHEAFEIIVATDALFPLERNLYRSQSDGGLSIDVPEMDADTFAAATGGLAEVLVTKLLTVPDLARDRARLHEYKSETLRDYVRGQAQLDELQNNYSILFKAVDQRLKSKLRGINRELTGRPQYGAVAIQAFLEGLREALREDAPGLSGVLCEDIARHVVAKWLVQCPLYFPIAAA